MRIESNTIANAAITAACAVVVVLGGIKIWDRMMAAPVSLPNPMTDVQPFDLSLTDLPLQGNRNAAGVMVEVSDFQCPFCGRYAKETYEQIKQAFVASGRIQYAFINFPLPNHQYARGAAEAAACAHAQGRFWPMHDRLFASQDLLSPDNLLGYAREIGLDAQAFQACLSARPQPLVNRDLELAKRMGVQSTPTFFLGTVSPNGTAHLTQKIVGAQAFELFGKALNERSPPST